MLTKIKQQLRLCVIFIVKILFAKSYLPCSFIDKIKANRHGYLADQYVLYNLRQNGYDTYLSEMDWYRSRVINKPFDVILNNKIICNEVLAGHQAKVPQTFAVKNLKQLQGRRGETWHSLEVLELLRTEKRLFMKPYLAGRGKDVFLLAFVDGLYYVNNQPISEVKLVHLLTSQKNYILTEVIEPHQYSKDIFAASFNTIRLVTIRDELTGQVSLTKAVQRLGCCASIPVDNGSRGALVADIDLESGRLSAAQSIHALDIHSHHPDTLAPIAGVVIPHWQAIKAEVIRLASELSYLQLIAFDVILNAEAEIYCIEANNSSGINILQLWGGLKQAEFGKFLRSKR